MNSSNLRYNKTKLENRNEKNSSSSNKKINNEIIKNTIAKIGDKPLSQSLTIDDINLPNGIAYQIADIKNLMNTNQLRKFFDMIKNVEDHTNNVARCQEELIKILPQIAYSVGRKNCDSDFFELMKACISKKTLFSEKDIKTLIDFVTSIVAYHKYLHS